MARYIDADALGIGYANPKVFNSEEYARGWNSAIDIINSAPTISPDGVRGVGEWVKNHDEVMWWWECSNCKEKPLISRFGDAEVLSAYCPRCGAKLEIPEGE